MKILHLISSGGRYGAENVVLNLTESLQGLGCDTVLGLFQNTHRPNTEIADLARQRGVTVEIIPCKGRMDWKAVSAIRRCVKTYGIDLIHTHGYKADFFGWMARRKLGVPLVATIHIWSERNAYLHFYTILDRRVLRRFDKAVGVSNEIVNLLRRARIAPEKIGKVSNGIHVELFEGAFPTLAKEIGKTDRVIVGMVSRLLPEKGVIHFVRAAQQVLAVCPQAFFVLVGDGPEAPRLKALARELGIEDSVLFAGQRSDMPSVYASFDIFVLPSLNEGMPLVILEAMAAKRAVIATRIAGIPEIIQHEKTGLLIDPGEIVPLRDSIVRLIADERLRDRLAEDGYARVRQFHSREAMSRSYLHLYGNLLRLSTPAEDAERQKRTALQPNETGQRG